MNAEERQEPEQLPVVDQEHCVSQRWSIVHLPPTAAEPLPRGPMVEWALAAPASHLAKSSWVSLSLSEFPLWNDWYQSETLAGSKAVFSHGECDLFSLRDILRPRAGKKKKKKKNLISSREFEDFIFFSLLQLEEKWSSTPFQKVTAAGADSELSRLHPWLSTLITATEVEPCGSQRRAVWNRRDSCSREDPLGFCIPAICDPFLWHCPEVCCWEAILHSEIPYLERECNIYIFPAYWTCW